MIDCVPVNVIIVMIFIFILLLLWVASLDKARVKTPCNPETRLEE